MPDSRTTTDSSPDLQMVPFDFETCRQSADWREGFAWPIHIDRTRAGLAHNLTVYTELCAAQTDPDWRDVALLAAPRILSKVGALKDAAMAVAAAREQRLQLVGAQPELDYLSGRWPTGDSVPATTVGHRLSMAVPRFRFGRRLVRTGLLSGAFRTPLAIAWPQTTAITHNALLGRTARFARKRIAFDHATSLLAEARAKAPESHRISVDDLSDMIRAALLDGMALPEDIAKRLSFVVDPVIRAAIAESASDFAALLRLRLPADIWAGTNVYHPTRAISFAVLRQGGSVSTFDHGGCTGMLEYNALALNELAGSTRLVVPTDGVANLVRKLVTTRPLSWKTAEIAGGYGDPTFRPMRRLPAEPAAARPKVVFAAGVFYGFRQWYPPILPDPVYYDWIIRLLVMLKKMPIDLLCKPHPEGLLKGQRHVMADMAMTTDRPFEQVLPEANVLLYDDVHSTTFWESMCADRRLVLIDLGYNRFSPAIRPLAEQRCRIVRASYDSRNRPQIDAEELATAICGEPERRGNPEPFRELLTGNS